MNSKTVIWGGTKKMQNLLRKMQGDDAKSRKDFVVETSTSNTSSITSYDPQALSRA
jgi:hypothetical protein